MRDTVFKGSAAFLIAFMLISFGSIFFTSSVRAAVDPQQELDRVTDTIDSCGYENQSCCKEVALPEMKLPNPFEGSSFPLAGTFGRWLVGGLNKRLSPFNKITNKVSEGANDAMDKTGYTGGCKNDFTPVSSGNVCTCVTNVSASLLASLPDSPKKSDYLASLQESSNQPIAQNKNVLGLADIFDPFSIRDIDKTDCFSLFADDKEKAICLRCAPIPDPEEDECVRCLADPMFPGTWTAIGCVKGDLRTFLIENVFGLGLGLAGVSSLLCIIYAAIQMQVSSGNPEAIKKAQETMTACILGLIVVIFSILILQIIGVNILLLPNFSAAPLPGP
ncbi:hypothetical protein KC726_03745 [Candidatus Woesebacteria bacterium]|nr:hypothetical protein [Candidatus Woesebacteria bacterium]